MGKIIERRDDSTFVDREKDGTWSQSAKPAKGIVETSPGNGIQAVEAAQTEQPQPEITTISKDGVETSGGTDPVTVIS